APDNIEVTLLLADLAVEAKDFTESSNLLRAALKTHPKEAVLFQHLARTEVLAGHPEAAIAQLREGLKKVPENGNLIFSFAELLIDNPDLGEADRQIEHLRSLSLPPVYAEYLKAHQLFKK